MGMKQVTNDKEAQKMLEEILRRYGLMVMNVCEKGERVSVKVEENPKVAETQHYIN
jgi:hypothetical protein